MNMPNIMVCQNDLPNGLRFDDGLVAIDTETDGLDVTRVNLWLVQVADSAGNVWLVKFDGTNYTAPNLRSVLENPRLTKLFHYARFDVAMLQRKLGLADIGPLFCSKIASKLVQPDLPKHNLRTLVQQFCGVELDKTEQLSDWSVPELTKPQKAYAAADVLYLAAIYKGLTKLVAEASLTHALHMALQFLPTRVQLDLAGFDEKTDIFSH
jgi:ribonuclease D